MSRDNFTAVIEAVKDIQDAYEEIAGYVQVVEEAMQETDNDA